MTARYDLGFIGAGNMAEGILAAAVAEGSYPAERIVVADPVAERRGLFAEQFGVTVVEDNRAVAAESSRVVVAVKPQSFDEVAAGLAGAGRDDQLWISIMAGVGTERIAAGLGGDGGDVRVVRVMPNLPIRVGAGIAGVYAGRHATEQDLADARALFDAGGSTVAVSDESLIDAVTAISGSGPAYFYYFVEAMVAGGTACGLSEDDALELAEYTCLGAARMMLETGEPPAELRRKVTSKGGTTQAALEHLERAGVGDAVRDAVRAACRRGKELGT